MYFNRTKQFENLGDSLYYHSCMFPQFMQMDLTLTFSGTQDEG